MPTFLKKESIYSFCYPFFTPFLFYLPLFISTYVKQQVRALIAACTVFENHQTQKKIADIVYLHCTFVVKKKSFTSFAYIIGPMQLL